MQYFPVIKGGAEETVLAYIFEKNISIYRTLTPAIKKYEAVRLAVPVSSWEECKGNAYTPLCFFLAQFSHDFC